jgi:hypothetical protein
MLPKRSEKLHRCGHAGGHLRDALLDALQHRYPDDAKWWNHIEIDFNEERDNRWFQKCSPRRRAQWLLGQLWHCTDIVPGDVRREVASNDPDLSDEWQVGTFAELARYLAQDLTEAEHERGRVASR